MCCLLLCVFALGVSFGGGFGFGWNCLGLCLFFSYVIDYILVIDGEVVLICFGCVGHPCLVAVFFALVSSGRQVVLYGVFLCVVGCFLWCLFSSQVAVSVFLCWCLPCLRLRF